MSVGSVSLDNLEYTPCSYPFTPPTPASYHCLFTYASSIGLWTRWQGPVPLISCHIVRVQWHHIGKGLAECLWIDWMRGWIGFWDPKDESGWVGGGIGGGGLAAGEGSSSSGNGTVQVSGHEWFEQGWRPQLETRRGGADSQVKRGFTHVLSSLYFIHTGIHCSAWGLRIHLAVWPWLKN